MPQRTLIVALLRLHPGQQEAFAAFEARACAVAARHSGRLERRFAMDRDAADSSSYDEVHVWNFRNRACFEAYRDDPELRSLAELRARAIADTVVLTGREAASFVAPATHGEGLTVCGLDHVYLSVSDLRVSMAFYDPVMRALGFWKGDFPIAVTPHAHYFNGLLQVTLRPAQNAGPHDPYAPGLHHLCLQAPNNTAVDRAYTALAGLGVSATAPRHYPEYNPDYYATFFEDPDGLRLELLARMPTRDAVLAEQRHFTHFLNPLAALAGERDGVFHIATQEDWQARRDGEYRPATFEREGFLHCSTRPQVLDTLARYFKGRSDLVLVQLDATRLGNALRYERPAPTKERPVPDPYPHLYAPLPIDAVLGVHALPPNPDGTFSWPQDMSSSCSDSSPTE